MATGSGGQSDRFLCLLHFMTSIWLLSSSSTATRFHVGGKDGWVVKPSEDYNHWAQRNRFQVNDTLNFKYKKGSDSVLVVKKEDYDSCNTKNPIQKMDGGDSTFVFNKSGPFYFISGNVDNCQNGQKLIVLVMAVRKPHSPPSVAPSPWNGPSPQPSEDQSGSNSPARPPSENSGSVRIRRARASVGVGLGVGVGLIFLFTSFAGLV